MRRAAIPSYLTLTFGDQFCSSLFFTLFLVYQVQVVEMNPFQVVFAGTVMELTCFLFEIPTGVVADLFSRRLSILIGTGIMGGSYLLQGAIPEYWAVLASGILWGFGYTFTSGANQAWITDEVGEQAVGRVFRQRMQVGLIAGIVGTIAAALLGLIDLKVPMILAGVLQLALTAWLVLTMPETPRQRERAIDTSGWDEFREMLRDGLRIAVRQPVARTVVIVGLIMGLASEAIDRLGTPLILEEFSLPTVFGTDSPAIWFGAIQLVGMMIAILITRTMDKPQYEHLVEQRPAELLTIAAGILVVSVAVFAIAPMFWIALVAIWVRQAVVAVMEPIESAWLNRNLPSETRATVISFAGQSRALGEVGGGPPMGALANAIGIRRVLLVSAGILLPIVPLYASQREKQR